MTKPSPGEAQREPLAGAAAHQRAEAERVVALDAGLQARRPADRRLRVGVGRLVDVEHDRRALGGDRDPAAAGEDAVEQARVAGEPGRALDPPDVVVQRRVEGEHVGAVDGQAVGPSRSMRCTSAAALARKRSPRPVTFISGTPSPVSCCWISLPDAARAERLELQVALVGDHRPGPGHHLAGQGRPSTILPPCFWIPTPVTSAWPGLNSSLCTGGAPRVGGAGAGGGAGGGAGAAVGAGGGCRLGVDVHAERPGDAGQSVVVALPDRAHLPLVAAAVDLHADHRGLGGEPGHREGERADAGFHAVRRRRMSAARSRRGWRSPRRWRRRRALRPGPPAPRPRGPGRGAARRRGRPAG